MATIRATWPDGLQVMFGDSYRTWDSQLQEFCRVHKRERPAIEVSPHPWISYGGLKWCVWENFQEQLDKEGHGRRAESFRFFAPGASHAKNMNAIFGKAKA